MGLDMYAFAIDKKDAPPPHEHMEMVNLAHWREFNALHDWMRKIYIKKGGGERFHCESLHLTISDLNHLRLDLIEKRLNPKFGLSIDHLDITKDFLLKARALELTHHVFYNSWE